MNRRLLLFLVFGLIAISLWLGKEQLAQKRTLHALQEVQTSPLQPSHTSMVQSVLPSRKLLKQSDRTTEVEPLDTPSPEDSWEKLGDQLGQGLGRLHQLFEKHPELGNVEGESRLDALPMLSTDPNLPDELRAELISEADFMMRSMIATVAKLGPGGSFIEDAEDGENETPPHRVPPHRVPPHRAHPFGSSLIAGVLDYDQAQRDALHQTLAASDNPQQAVRDQLTQAEFIKLIESIRGKPQSELNEEERREILDIVKGPTEFLK